MGYQKLNEVAVRTTVADGDYILCVLANSDVVRIKKADLANALASVMPDVSADNTGVISAAQYQTMIMSKGVSGNTYDANTLFENGIFPSPWLTNIPETNGLLIIMTRAGSAFGGQFFLTSAGVVYYRHRTSTSAWTATWKKITMT